MRSLILFLPLIVSCTSNDPSSDVVADTNTFTTRPVDTLLTPAPETLQPPTSETTDLKSAILGIWTWGEDENAAFVIKKDKIDYPDIPASYKYVLTADSFKIYYDDHVATSGIKMKGRDTMILTIEGEEQIYYRMKN